MPNLLGISVEGQLAPSFDLACLGPDKTPPDGWGIGYYPAGEPSGAVLKEPRPRSGSIRSELVKEWEHLASSIFLLHMRRATWGANTDANTQPFSRSYAGRDWLFAHAGSLRERFDLPVGRRFVPVGSTDTERVFCELLSRIAERAWGSLAEADLFVLQSWFATLNQHGTLTAIITDGHDLVAYADVRAEVPLHRWQFLPPHGSLVFGDADLTVDLGRRGIKSTKGVVLSTDALLPKGELEMTWAPVAPGSLIALRQGAVRVELAPPADGAELTSRPSSEAPVESAARPPLLFKSAPLQRPMAAEPKIHTVRHVTRYAYALPVERSTHVLRLTPYHDRLQRLRDHTLRVSVDGEFRDFEDVFGNRARGVELLAPYTELEIEATSTVECLETNPFDFRALHQRSTLPLVWMPWQRYMLTPYLLPPELPETQLLELVEYAQSFAKRNDGDLVDTLLDINWTVFREYRYVPGATTLNTTAFDVYASRQGVCQDFTNLFICLARLLGVPARYVCGYVWCPPAHQNQVQSEASHAWVQLYLPEVGWRGFDPTNGIVTQTDHIRVAVGRSYVDATPTAGTIWVGGGLETLSVDVKVSQIAPAVTHPGDLVANDG